MYVKAIQLQNVTVKSMAEDQKPHQVKARAVLNHLVPSVLHRLTHFDNLGEGPLFAAAIFV